MGKEIATQVQEAQRVPGRRNPRRKTQRYIVIKLTKIKGKEKLLKAKKQKRQTPKKYMQIPNGMPHKSTDFHYTTDLQSNLCGKKISPGSRVSWAG